MFITTSLITALVFWWFTDWWAYVDLPHLGGRIRKFIMPWWFQLLVSGLVGAVAGTLITGVWWLTYWWWRRNRTPPAR